MKLTPLTAEHPVRLSDDDARIDSSLSEKELERAIDKQGDRISDLQRVFYADARYALLIVLQGRDASGKDGTIRKVFSDVNPQGCFVSTFKAPTHLELRHDFLWRVHAKVPERGMIGIFNRSHYEDVLVPRVRGWITRKSWMARYGQINDFERMLSENNVGILKFMLHISRDEQKRRLIKRLDNPEKNWKFNPDDLDDRKRWDSFTKAYEGMLRHTSTEWAPWHVVPADDKDVRNLLIATTIADKLKSLRLRYPLIDPKVKKLEIE